GEEHPCGWLKDKFGVSWQIDPKDIEELTDTKDPVRGNRVNKALIEMTKIDVEKLRAAYRGD
ncbi:MAG: VOC family protein, partial [Patescibacteria group bacterium]